MYQVKVQLVGETFGSELEVIVQMPKRGGLTKGETERIVEDIADQAAAMNLTCRWETYRVGQMSSRYDEGLPFREIEIAAPKTSS
jgi:hypothetical protein